MRGEGNDGVIIYPKASTYGVVSTYKYPGGKKEEHQYGSLYAPDQKILVTPSLSSYAGVITLLAGKGFQELRAVDVDGDGVDELVKVNLAGVIREEKYSRRRIRIVPLATQIEITVYYINQKLGTNHFRGSAFHSDCLWWCF